MLVYDHFGGGVPRQDPCPRGGWGSHRGHVEVLKLLAMAGAPLSALDQRAGDTPLHVAIRQGHSEVVRYLASAVGREGLEAWSRAGDQVLHTAARCGNEQITDALLDHGADMNDRNRAGQTPLELALESDQVAVVKRLISRGADTNAPDSEGKVLIHHAAQMGYRNVVEMLTYEPLPDVA